MRVRTNAILEHSGVTALFSCRSAAVAAHVVRFLKPVHATRTSAL
jgi:hypothetical protein